MSSLSVGGVIMSLHDLCFVCLFNFRMLWNFALVCACVDILHNQFSWLIENWLIDMIKDDVVEKVVYEENDYV